MLNVFLWSFMRVARVNEKKISPKKVKWNYNHESRLRNLKSYTFHISVDQIRKNLHNNVALIDRRLKIAINLCCIMFESHNRLFHSKKCKKIESVTVFCQKYHNDVFETCSWSRRINWTQGKNFTSVSPSSSSTSSSVLVYPLNYPLNIFSYLKFFMLENLRIYVDVIYGRFM